LYSSAESAGAALENEFHFQDADGILTEQFLMTIPEARFFLFPAPRHVAKTHR
jgi:hypothetical protein